MGDPIELEKTWLGVPYRYAGRSRAGVDCVNLQTVVFTAAGHADLVDNSWTVGHLVDYYKRLGRTAAGLGAARPGDFLAFGHDGLRYQHVELYLGDGRTIGAVLPKVRVSGQMWWKAQRLTIDLVLKTGLWEASHPGPEPPSPTPPAPPAPRYHIVVRRDTLWAIARAELGDPHRYMEIYDLNTATIGPNPNLIKPRQKLLLPAR